jgi:DNA polymerase I-like protein with 3'-5' exonuclease and polymerase domains
MKYLTIDTECTCLKLPSASAKNLNGNPYAAVNKLCYVGLLSSSSPSSYVDYAIEYGDEPYGDALREIQEAIDNHDCLVFFNAKFDMHWIHCGHKRLFDTQLAEFILSNQRGSYPSLNDTALRYGLSGKLDVVKEEYWNKGVDTDEVPQEILCTYLKQDVEQTMQVFSKQKQIIPSSKDRLISLACQDLVTLFEIEKNGMLFDVQTSKTKGDEIQVTLNDIDKELISLTGFPEFNPASGDHISAILYGGSITIPYQEVEGVYKTGIKAGQPKLRWKEKDYIFPRIVEPPKGSELKKAGFYATNADTLRSLRGASSASIVKCILERSELEKLVGTYLHGLPKMMEEQGWKYGMIHGQLNQCVAITGRLSSSKPNIQNMDKSISYLFRTRYG